jgi:hypothetical protein
MQSAAPRDWARERLPVDFASCCPPSPTAKVILLAGVVRRGSAGLCLGSCMLFGLLEVTLPSLSVELTPSTSARTQLFTNTTHTAIQFPLRNVNCRVKSTPAQVCPSRQCERQPSQQPETNRLLFVLQNLLWIQKSRLGSRLASRLGSVFPAERAIRDRVVQCAANTPQLYRNGWHSNGARSPRPVRPGVRRAGCGGYVNANSALPPPIYY